MEERGARSDTMSDPFIRTRLLIGEEPLDRLAAARVAVFGVGGVGGFCVEPALPESVGEVTSKTVNILRESGSRVAVNGNQNSDRCV